uniref:Huntingtin-interacting protein K n=1 Tax=Lygus hesperus TaxID=30085 RepID=A0A0A9WYV2_LYGHE
MADDVHEVNGDSDEHQQNNEDAGQKKSAKHDSGAADLERVTDYAEEKEISAASDEFKGAMSFIGDLRNKEAAEKMAKERELLKVAISKEDVDLIVNEFEISRPKAERVLREHLGNVVDALTALTN